MKKNYNPQEIEQPLYARWEANRCFLPSGKGQPYCIMIPPPNITGNLHMGHAFQHTIMDCLIRYYRMQGRDVLWQIGTDHAGIATQMLVERRLRAQGLERTEMGREAFTDEVWKWRVQSGSEILEQLRRIGASVDWSKERFTMDAGYSRAVREAFVRLYRDGLIYRGLRLVNWDPELQTAISDLEVVNEECEGQLWYIRYPLAGTAATMTGERFVTVATTRPETMLGDVAVAVHPNDARYRSLHGARVLLPLTAREIPVICDEYVDPEFGSGCVKITPAHDVNDYEMALRHDLPLINIFHVDASINDSAPPAYRGLDRFRARARIGADLQELQLVARIEKHRLVIPRGDRSGAVIEPRMTRQWFVAIKALTGPAVEAVRSGRVRFVPKAYENTFFSWMREIRDWCISRQQWWGHRIPAWYDDGGGIHVGLDERDARQCADLPPDARLHQEEDVLETWFSSSLWSLATLGWPEKTPELARYHPTSVLVTGHDIIFFWVARMIMMSLRLQDQIPFHEVYVHGLVRDAAGQKMSKTKGNGLDPLDLMDGIGPEDLVAKRVANLLQPQMAAKIAQTTKREYPQGIPSHGADALRFTFCALASMGPAIRFDLQRIAGYRNFCNKLWNAAGFVFEHTRDRVFDSGAECELDVADRWIRSRLNEILVTAAQALESYRFDIMASSLYEFVWHDYCDWYLELVKPVLWAADTAAARRYGVCHTLLVVLERALRALHPIIPFITETLWLQCAPLLGLQGDSIMHRPYPKRIPAEHAPQAVAVISWLRQVAVGIRSIRAEMAISPNRKVDLLFQGGAELDRELVTAMEAQLRWLTKADSISWLAPDETPPPAAICLVGNLRIWVPLGGLIDKDVETRRLARAIEKGRADLVRVRGKLARQSFLSKAPAVVVEKERTREAELAAAVAGLEEQHARLLAI